MHKIKNIDVGPRGVNGPGGIVMIEPGETKEVELSEAEHKSSTRTGWFEIDGKGHHKPKGEDGEGDGGVGGHAKTGRK